MEKLEWLGYPMVKKFPKISLFVLAQLTNVTDRRTGKRTPHAGNQNKIARLHWADIISSRLADVAWHMMQTTTTTILDGFSGRSP